jgi:nicotinamidase-related amidase
MTNTPFHFTSSPATSWTVHDGYVSLVRMPVPPAVVRLPAIPSAVDIDLARSALVIIDMQNDFCHPEGWFGSRGVDVSPVRRPIPVIADLAEKLRNAGGRIVWLNWGIRADRANLPSGVQYRGKRTPQAIGYGEQLPNGRGPVLVQGAWGAALIDELQAQPGDLLVHKHRLSGFWDNDLDSALRLAGVTTLLFAGVNIDRCVFSTLQDAGSRGYDCVLIEDACATVSPQYVSDAILFLVREVHGFTATSADLISSISSASPPTSELTKGK